MLTISEPELVRLLNGWRDPAHQPGYPGPGYAALAGALQALLLDARLPAGARLPAERRLASHLGISRTTVAAAYRLLRDEGFMSSRQGSGSFTTLPAGRLRRHTPWVPAVPDDLDALDLAMAAPEACDGVSEAMAAALQELPRYLHGHGYDSYGLPVLRDAIARRYARRGLATDAGQIFVTAGAQHALDLVLRCLASPFDPVITESPTYPNALDALARSRTRVIAVGLGPDGDYGPLLAALRQGVARIAYLMPDFQNPTGCLMDGPWREALVGAAAGGTRLIADETFAELALTTEPTPAPLASWDPEDRVISIGSMSKAFWAGLRIGWVRADPALTGQLQAVRAPSDLASPVVEQLAAAWLLDHSEQLLAPRQAMLARRRDALAAALTGLMPELEFRLPAGGLSLWARLDAPISTALARTAESCGLRLVPGPRFGPPGAVTPGGGLERYLRLPYTLPEPDLTEAARRLAAARASLTGRARRPDQPLV